MNIQDLLIDITSREISTNTQTVRSTRAAQHRIRNLLVLSTPVCLSVHVSSSKISNFLETESQYAFWSTRRRGTTILVHSIVRNSLEFFQNTLVWSCGAIYFSFREHRSSNVTGQLQYQRLTICIA